MSAEFAPGKSDAADRNHDGAVIGSDRSPESRYPLLIALKSVLDDKSDH